MFPRLLTAVAAGQLLCAFAGAQNAAPPSQFRLVTPHSRGAIMIDSTGGWKLERVVVYDNGQRPVVQMTNVALHVNASYMLDDEPQYNDTTEMCRNDMLGGVMKGIGKVAEISNMENSQLDLPDGQTMLTGSYFVRKQEGQEVHQQALWGFVAAHHLCAAVHLSHTPSEPGDNSALEPLLKSVRFEPDYQPTPADLAAMAQLLPPAEAAPYRAAVPGPVATDSGKKAPSSAPGSLEFSLPDHPGWLAMDAPGYAITEMSAKPNGHEFGIRADDPGIHTEVLGFLFVAQPPKPSAVACRDWMLTEEQKTADGRKILKKYESVSHSGVPLALVEYETPKARPEFRFSRRALVAEGDLCADILLSARDITSLGPSQVLLDTLRFEPRREPDFDSVFRYGQVVFDHQDYAHAAPYFEQAVPLAAAKADALQWQRIATDQASMSYGMSGDLARSRAINEAAIAKDPDYPLYYYNLACADAEQGDAAAAHRHLDQAFQRRAKTIPGEHLPDPAKDDSILKLKKNKEFWTFVESLPKS